MRIPVALNILRLLAVAQLREQPLRLIVTLTVIAIGVALGASVYLVNATALDEFGLAAKHLIGESDIVLRGPREGFSEALYPQLARDPAVRVASPVLEIEAALPGRSDTLKVLGLDPFRAAALQGALFADIAGGISELLLGRGIYLSSSAAAQLQKHRGDSLTVTVGDATRSLTVIGILSQSAYPRALALMDIAAAQWTFDKVGLLNRIDLQLVPGTSTDAFREKWSSRLPPGVLAIAPMIELDRAATVTRAYRINLNVLALVALWTGAFLVFSTQSLSVLRRRRSLALLRALGVTRRELELALVGEGAALGAAGSLLGVLLGLIIAAALVHALTGDLGNGQLAGTVAGLHAAWPPLMLFFLAGTCVASAGAWLPARHAARLPPANALKGGDVDFRIAARYSWRAGAVCLVVGAVLAPMPAVAGLPVFGYASIAALLFGGVLLVPVLTLRALKNAPRAGHIVWNTAIAQLRENVGLSALSLASVIVSFSLMVAMAIMVFSFRVSFEHWLGKLLPADLQLRVPAGSDSAYWTPVDQAKLAAVPGIARIEFRRTQSLLLDAARPSVTLIARGADAQQTAAALPLVQTAPVPPGDDLDPAWISESLQDLYGLQPGGTIELPLAAKRIRFRIAGVWRDYARAFGAVVISRPSYMAATRDSSATEGSVWLDGRASPAAVEGALRGCFPRRDLLEITTSAGVKQRSLQLFDRAFAITYALEAVAVLIGLAGVSFAASATALARRSEFGVLRHVGMLRRQIIRILASEGLLMSAFGVLYGVALGAALSLVLVFVVNRQSFNWSIDWSVPFIQLATLSFALVAAAAVAAVWSGRAATGVDAIRAVREDW